MMKPLSFCALLLFLFPDWSSGYRILCVFPNFLKSHSIFTHAIAKELARKGHDVTIITPFEDSNPLPNYKQVIADQKSLWELNAEEAEAFLYSDVPFVAEALERWYGLSWFTETGLNSSQVTEFIKKDNGRYDLVITELFLQEAFLMFGHKYGAPVVMLSSFGSGHYINEQIGNPLLLPVVPNEFVDFYGPLTLWQRTKNTLLTAFDLIGRRYFHLPHQQALAEKYFGNLPKPLPKLSDLERNVSLIMVNTHFSIDSVRPKVPGIIEVGGVHIVETNLPSDLQAACDKAKDGIIFFSLGTIIKGSHMPKNKIDQIIKVFSSLKQTIIWKWESDETPRAPKNIIFSKWLPQTAILKHPNTKLFITHCGLLGIQESIYYGVPIIGMPFFGDQFINIDRASKQGYGVKLRFKDITEKTLKSAIELILNDKSFEKNAKQLSKRFRDKPQTPLETAVYWIEYVIRNDGAKHVRSPILDLYWYEYLLLDVAAVVLLGTTTIGIAAYCFIMIFCKLLLFRKPYKRKCRPDKEN